MGFNKLDYKIFQHDITYKFISMWTKDKLFKWNLFHPEIKISQKGKKLIKKKYYEQNLSFADVKVKDTTRNTTDMYLDMMTCYIYNNRHTLHSYIGKRLMKIIINLAT